MIYRRFANLDRIHIGAGGAWLVDAFLPAGAGLEVLKWAGAAYLDFGSAFSNGAQQA